jgi:hypothetical protein
LDRISTLRKEGVEGLCSSKNNTTCRGYPAKRKLGKLMEALTLWEKGEFVLLTTYEGEWPSPPSHIFLRKISFPSNIMV